MKAKITWVGVPVMNEMGWILTFNFLKPDGTTEGSMAFYETFLEACSVTIGQEIDV